ncbi:zinc finger protein 687b-like isoform X4 [Thunnus maccoyii]|uniref:zinc finger protein 687b-like isoform X4 n=1 Tax=Thunnus maccoyii TaxID=8240 RepID=UPI001C4A8621|nr:zinc finger protein 687b-like isoform X4 [Thunnus maccoyii]
MVNRTTMSADDFQTKYASVMESMLRSAVAETTKLFETMVDELKAEISMIKKENEDLKTRCSQFENAKSQPTVHTGEREPPPGPIDGSEKRDTAVQCDLVPFCTMLVEQCQPLRHSSWQNQEQQCGYEEMEQCLQKDQDYEERNSLMPLVKKEEEIEPTVVCRQGLSDNADPPQASACGTETEGLLINQECSNGEMTLHQKDEETRVAMEPPCSASTNDFADARASCSETSADDKRKLQKNSLVARLRSHLKTHLQARRTETNTELLKETETTPVSPEKPRLENVSQKETNTPSEPVSLNKLHVDDVTSLKNIPNDPTSISPGRSGLCKDGVRSKRTFSEPTSVSCRSKLSKNNPDPKRATSKSTPVSHRRSSFARDVVDPENTKSISVSPRSSSSTIEGVSTKKTKTSSETPRRCTAKDNASPKKTQSTSLSPRRTSSTRDGTAPKNTKSTSVSPKHCSSVRDSASPKKTKSTPASPRRSRSAREHASPKKTKSISARPRKSSLIKNGSSPEMSSSELTPVSLRRYTSTKDGSSAKQIKRESYSFSPRRYSNTTDGGEIGTPSARQPKLTKYGARHQRTGESTPAKRPRLIQDVTIPKKTLRLVNAKKLSKAAKAKTLAKMKNSNQSTLQNGAKTSHIAKNGANCEVVKRFTSKAVWIPPIMPVSKTASLGGKRSSLLPIKKETSSPRSKNHTVIYPTVRGPPIVSPLQPLLVIGRCLLKNQCGECGRVLSSSAALESHVSCHTGHRPFSCTLCGKSFPDSKGFKRHGRVHRNGRIHICQQCGKGFVYRFGLTKHLQMVHGRIKPFVCQICGKAFFAKRDVETHIRIHTGEKPFPCNLCEKRFARRVELNVHLRWHNGEKRHWCPYCGKGFLDSNNLKRHKYTHTGEKPHSCPHCPKNFTQSGHLKKHVKNVHKIQ